MKRSSSSTTKRPNPIVVEPDDEISSPTGLMRSDDFWSPFRRDDIFGNFSREITDFHKKFENLEKQFNNRKEGSTEVRQFSSYIEYKDGKVIKKDEKGIHFKNDNGKGFYKTIKMNPDGNKVEDLREFDYTNNRNLPRLK